jgi:hypothetical protein
MDKTVNADETVVPEQGWRFRRKFLPGPKYIVESQWLRWAELLGYCSSCSPPRPGQLGAVASIDRENWATDVAGISSSTTCSRQRC